MTGNAVRRPGGWFQPEEADPEAEVRLFLFPYAGGNAAMYREWPDLFPQNIAVQALQLPGRVDRSSESPFDEMDPLIEAMCEAFAAELDDRPYAVFGHSMGALLAYRLAIAMEREMGNGPILLGSAGWVPEGFAAPTKEQIDLPQDELVEWVIGLGSVPPALYQDPELLALTMPPTRADLTLTTDYVDDGARMSCPVVTYTAKEDPLMATETTESWAPRCSAYLGNCEFPGGHFFIYHEALAITADLTRHLRRAAATAG
jgi:surfactin synthase thioesterase subunit